MEMGSNTCKCPHHKIFPALITLFGLALLANALSWITSSSLYVIVAVLVIVLGLTKMVRCKCCTNGVPNKM